MTNFIVIEKDSLNKSTVNATQITLTEASIVHTKMSRDDVDEFIRDGNNLVLKLKNGEVVVIENFFITYDDVASDLVFEEDGCVLYWFDGVSGFKGIPGLEALLPAVESSQLVGLLPWLVGAAVVGGAAAIIDHNNDDDDKNRAPTATTDPVTTPEDEPVKGKVTGSDRDGDDLTYVVKEQPKNGTLELDPETGDYTYTPNPDFNGEDSFVVTVDDGNGGTVEVPVTVTVTPVNDAPVAGEDNKETPEDTPVDGKVPVTDVDGDDLTYVVKEQPKNGTLELDPETGDYTYTPNPDFNGEDSFVVTVDDGNGGTVEVPVTVTVTPVNDAPVAGEDNKETPEDTPVDGKVPVTDVDGDDLTYVVKEQPKNGTLELDPETGDYTYTPNPDFNGEDSFVVTVDDGNGGTVEVPVTVTVTPVNDAPVAGEDNKETPEDTPVDGKVPVTDVDGDDLTYVVKEQPKNGTLELDPETGDYTYTPNPDFNGEDSFVVTVDDGNGGTVEVPVTVTVTPVNDAPVAGEDNKETPEDTPVDGKVPVTDVDGDDLTYVVKEQPKNGTLELDPETGDYTYTPNPDFNGEDSFVVTVDDGNGGTVEVPVTVTVTPVNDAPVAGEDNKETPEDTPVDGKVPVTDVDGDDLTYVVKEQPKNGTLELDPETGDYTYTPNPDFNGEDSFVVTVDDGNGGTVEVPVTVTVTPVNDAPVAGEDNKETPEDTPVDGKVPVTDVDGDDLTYVVKEQPKNGTLELDPETGDYTYTPNPDFNGEDSFVVTVDDGNGGTVEVPVTVTVTPVNDAPVAGEDNKETPEDTPVDGKVPVTDVDGDDLTYVVKEQPKNGTLELDPETGDYTYTPNPDFNGEDSFVVTVDDGNGGTVEVPVTVTVTPVNDAPVAGEDNKETPEDTPVDGKVPVTDVDGDDLTYVVKEQPKNGTLELDPETGDYTYTPNPDFNGEDSFVVTVDDGNGETVEVPVTVTVTPVNDAPVAGEDNKETPEDTPVDGKVPVTDVDGDDLTYVVKEQPKNGTLELDPETGDYTYTPNPDFNGEDSFVVTVDDGNGGTVEVPVTVTVTPVNDAPVAGEDNKETPEDTPVDGKVPVTDVDGDDLTYVVKEQPKNGTLELDPETGDYTYTPNPDFNGEDSFVVTVDDGNGGTVEVPVTVTVTPVNDAPVAGEDNKETPEDTPVDGKVPVTDVDGDDLTYVVKEQPKNGTLELDPETGDYTYTPNPDFNGEDSFVVTVDDGNGGTVEVPVTVTVTPVNDAPVAGEDNKETPEDTPVDGKVPVTDVDGDDLTYVVKEQPKNGTLELDPETGDYTYTPNPDFNGEDSFVVTVDDGNGGTVEVPVTVTVTPVNDAPVAGEDNKETPEDTPVDGKVPVTDVDGDDLTYVVKEQPKNGTLELDPETGDYTYTPNPDFNGEDSFVVTVDDGNGETVEVPVTVTVTPVNDAPVAGEDNKETPEDTPVDGKVPVTDVDGDDLTYVVKEQPKNGTLELDPETGDYTYTPNPDFNGEDSFVVTVDDGNGGTVEVPVTVTVTPVNDAPVAGEDNKETPEDTPVDGKVPVTDVDGDDLTYVVKEQPKNGTLELDPETGDYTYTPNPDFNGEDSFVVTVDDGNGGTVEVPVTVTVTPVNDAPVAGEDNKETPEDTPVDGKVPVTDVDGDDLTYVVKEQPKNGTLELDPETGDYTYTPNPDFNGEDSFVVTVDDGNGGTVEVPVTVTVTPVNDAPVAGEDNKETPEDTPVDGKVPVTDVDGDDLTYVVKEQPKNGTLELDPETGDYTYTPNPDFNGEDSFVVTVDDGNGGTVEVPVTVTVTPVNDAPVAGEDNKETPEDTPVDGKVPVTDVDGDDLTYVVKEQPKNGTLELDPETGDYTYTPNPDFNGEDSFVVTVDDGNGGTVEVPVTVTVTPVNDAPVAGEDNKETPEDTPVDGKVPVTDVDGDDLTYVVKEQPKNGTLELDPETGDYTYTPNPDFNGEDSFVVTVDDGNGGTVEVPVTVTVTPVNDAPVAENDTVTPVHNAPVEVNVLTNDTDADAGDTLTVKDFTVEGTKYQPGDIATITGVGTITITEEGVLTFEPETDYVGPVPEVTYTVTDGTAEDTATVTFDEVPAAPNQAPVAENDTVTPVHNAPVEVNVLTNDTDADADDTLTVKDFTVEGTKYQPGDIATITGVGTITITEEGVLTFEPETDYVGPVPEVTYTVTDGTAEDTATVTFDEVPAAPNQAPVAENDTVTPVHNAPVEVNVLTNDTDADADDTLTVKDFTVEGTKYQPGDIATITGVGTITITEEGVLTFEPETDYVGPVPEVTYTVTDGTAEDTATVTFDEVPAAPPIIPDATTLEDGTTMLPNALAEVSGMDWKRISSIQVGEQTVNLPNNFDGTVKTTIEIPDVGTLTMTTTGEATFTPVKDFSGMVEIPTITYTLSDNTTIEADVINVQVIPVADQPLVGEFNFDPVPLNLNIQTWTNVKQVNGFNLIERNGDGANKDTLLNAIDYLRDNPGATVTNNDNSAVGTTPTESTTVSLTDTNLPTFNAVYISGFVFLEAGQTYEYKGAADDSAAIVIGDGVSSEHVNWRGVSEAVDSQFSVSQTGYYSFQFYAHNASNVGNYNFTVQNVDGTQMSYYPNEAAIQNSLEDSTYILGDYDAGIDGKNDTGFYPIHMGYVGQSTEVIALTGIHLKATDVDGSEYLSFVMSGLPESAVLSFKDADGNSHEVTVDPDGKATYIPEDKDAGTTEYTDFTLKVGSKNEPLLDVTLVVTSTEKMNGDVISIESTLPFKVEVTDAEGSAGRSMSTAEANDANDFATDEDSIFKVLNQEYTFADSEANQVDGFTIGSDDQIDISSLLSSDATESNLAEFVSVDYDAENKQAVISIDRDGSADQYHSEDLVVLLNQPNAFDLDDLVQNNQIVIG